MKKIGRFLLGILELIVVVYVITITAFLLSKNKYGYTQFGKYTIVNVDLFTEKQNTGVKDGDLLIIKNSNDIKKGDVIYYYAIYNEAYIVRSKPVFDVQTDEFTAIYYVGDEGKIDVPSSKVIGKYVSIYNHWGSILNVLESRLGFLFGVLLPIILIFIYQVYEFIIIIKYQETPKEEKKEKE